MFNSNNESKGIMYLKRVGYAAAAITAIATLSFSVDGRYQKAAAAEEKFQQIAEVSDQTHYAQNLKREEGDIRTQITLIQLELTFMEQQQIADQARKVWLTEQLKVLLNLLSELQR